MNYKDSGVDVDLAENLVEEYLTDFSSQIGKFAASMDTPIRSHSSDLVVSVDGVGTKTILAKQYIRIDQCTSFQYWQGLCCYGHK